MQARGSPVVDPRSRADPSSHQPKRRPHRPIGCPTCGRPATRENEILGRLLGLYEEERQVYGRIRDLTLEQGEQLRQGAPLTEIRRILEQKKACLDVIGRLELTEQHTRNIWARERATWSGTGKARLQSALQAVADVIEDILAAEEKCDLYLIEQAQAV